MKKETSMHATKRQILFRRVVTLALLLALMGVSLLTSGTVRAAAEETGVIYIPPDTQEYYVGDYEVDHFNDSSSMHRDDERSVHFLNYAVILENSSVDLREYLLPQEDQDKAVVSDGWPQTCTLDRGSWSFQSDVWKYCTFSADGHTARLKIRTYEFNALNFAYGRTEPGYVYDDEEHEKATERYLQETESARALENIPYGTSYRIVPTSAPEAGIVSKENDAGRIDAANPEASPVFSYKRVIDVPLLDGGFSGDSLYKRLATGKAADGSWEYISPGEFDCCFVVYNENPEYLPEDVREAGRQGAADRNGAFEDEYALGYGGDGWLRSDDNGVYFEFGGCNEIILIDGGWRWLVEERAPEGYAAMPEPLVYSTDINGNIVEMLPNEDIIEAPEIGYWAWYATNYKEAALTVTKEAAEDDKLLLEGAEFALYRQDPAADPYLTPVDIQTTGEDGTAVFQGLAATKTYYLKETKAPDGYELSDEILEVTVDDDGTDVAVTVKNTKSPDDPVTPDEPDDPTPPVEPDDPTPPVEPDDPTSPVEPDDPAPHVDPAEPVAPERPARQDAPAVPVTSAGVEIIRTGDDNGRSMSLLAAAALIAVGVMTAVAARVTVVRKRYRR